MLDAFKQNTILLSYGLAYKIISSNPLVHALGKWDKNEHIRFL